MCIGIMAWSEDGERKKRLNGMMSDLQMVDPLEILPLLTCLSPMRKEQIRCRCKTDGAMIAAAELMEELPKREGWYDDLVKALRAMGKNKFADELEGPELRSSPSGPSQNAASGSSSQSAQMNPIQARQQHHSPSLPASDPEQTRPEAEASFSPDYPSSAEDKDVQRKGAKKEVHNSEVDANPGQQPPSNAPLQTPVQEERQGTPVSDPQAVETGGSAASSPSRDLQVRHDGSESDECNANPVPDGGSHMKGGVSGEAVKFAQNTLPSNSSPAMDAGAVGVSVPQRVDELSRREVEKREEELRNKSESEQELRNHPNNHGKQNNLSPTIGSRETNRNSDRTNNEDSIREEELTGIHPLSSREVDRTAEAMISLINSSEINEGISTASQSDNLLRRVGSVVRGYIPTVCNAVGEHILKP